MSYDCCKRITLNKGKNYIGLCVASNNVFPKSYGTYEMCSRDKEIYKIYNFEDKLICLLRSMLSGDIQITSINSNTEKFEYALIKVREYLRDNTTKEFHPLLWEGKQLILTFSRKMNLNLIVFIVVI